MQASSHRFWKKSSVKGRNWVFGRRLGIVLQLCFRGLGLLSRCRRLVVGIRLMDLLLLLLLLLLLVVLRFQHRPARRLPLAKGSGGQSP